MGLRRSARADCQQQDDRHDGRQDGLAGGVAVSHHAAVVAIKRGTPRRAARWHM